MMYSENETEESLIKYNKNNKTDTKICIKHEIDEAEKSFSVKAEPCFDEDSVTVLKCESDLYEDHIVKEDCDMVIGPVVIQAPSLQSKQSPVSIRERIIFEEEHYENDISSADSNSKKDISPELDNETQKRKPNISKKANHEPKLNSRTLTCHICNKHFTYQCNLNRHLKQIHNRYKSASTSYRCKVCDKQFSRKDNLKSHTNIHNIINAKPNGNTPAKLYSCNLCGKKFNHPSNRSRHKRLYCAKENYNNHVQERIPKDKTKFICDICKDGFASKTDIIRHIFAHNNIKPFKCRLCPNRNYSRKSGLNNHILSRHNNGIKNFACTKCEKKYVRSYSLRLHEMDAHSD